MLIAAWVPVLGALRSIPDAESAHTDLWQKYEGPCQMMPFRADPFFLLQTVCAPEKDRFPTHFYYWTGMDPISSLQPWVWIIAFMRNQSKFSPYKLQEACFSETSMSKPRRLKSEHAGLLWCTEPISRYRWACLRRCPPCLCPFSCFSHTSNSLSSCMVPNKSAITFTFALLTWTFLWKVTNDLPNHTASQRRRQQHP
jgi:hypothetical protein